MFLITRSSRTRALSMLCAASIVSCKSSTSPGGNSCNVEICILFVGGSLEYWNDMPTMVETLGNANGRTRIRVGGSFLPGSTLGDHIDAGEAEKEIRTGNWNVVSLGQGPSSRSESRALLRQWVGQFAPVIKGAGATPALYMTWPTVANVADFPGASTSYRLAASDVGGILFPVADAWTAAWAMDNTIELYGPDGWHPSVEGSYLAALVIYAALFKTSAVGLPSEFAMSNGLTVSIPAERAAILQLAADQAVSRGANPALRR